MFLQIENFLSPDEVKSVAELARQANFIEGRRSNPHNPGKDSVIGDPNDPQAQKASQIALAAFSRNEEARIFYESLGFDALNVVQGYYQGREAALRMTRRLGLGALR